MQPFQTNASHARASSLDDEFEKIEPQKLHEDQFVHLLPVVPNSLLSDQEIRRRIGLTERDQKELMESVSDSQVLMRVLKPAPLEKEWKWQAIADELLTKLQTPYSL